MSSLTKGLALNCSGTIIEYPNRKKPLPVASCYCYCTGQDVYWWFACDVIKQDYANYDQFAPNFGMVYKTMQYVSVPNSKLFGQMKTEIWAKEVREFSINMLYGKMGWQALHAYQHGCRNINV